MAPASSTRPERCSCRKNETASVSRKVNKNIWIVAAVVAVILLVIGSFLILDQFGPTRVVVLDLKAGKARDVNVVGVIVVDGEMQRFEGKAPGSFKYRAKRVEFQLTPADLKATDILEVAVNVDGKFVMSVTSPSGARGEIYQPALLTRWRQRLFITSLPSADADVLRGAP
jgi:hypothetical protein